MSKNKFFSSLVAEVKRIDKAQVTKRQENIIDGFTEEPSPKAIINRRKYRVFNSNDYLGLRHFEKVKTAEHKASEKFGAGPGAVRFISGSLKVHKELEKALAEFHGREDAMIFSSAFATNLAVIFSLIKGQSKDSLISNNALVISDELNHRSIIDGIRLANLSKEQKKIFKHLDADSLSEVLADGVKKFDRAVVITDGIFSMLGEYQDLKKINKVIKRFDKEYKEGVLLIVDDCHGIGAFGETGRGTEEVSKSKADVLIGTLGKGFGVDGGYVVANQKVINYLRESAATYIYSNNISPGTAGAALAAVKIASSKKGESLVRKLLKNVDRLKNGLKKQGFVFAADSIHPIQPILIGDTEKTKAFTEGLFEEGFLVTNINYPVVPKGKDEIRVQLSASHTNEDIDAFIKSATKVGKKLRII
jgi:glycine C-acetyltransferase